MANNVDEVLLKLRIAEEGVKVEINNARKSLKALDDTSEDYKRTVDALMQSEAKLRDIRNQVKQRNKELENSYKDLTKSTKNTDRATGGATASVLELGRVISDSNYGIRGMANNLSQLGTSMAFTFKSAGSLAAGFQSLWTAMLGPLGVIVAFNALLAVLERYEMQSTKAKKATEEHNNALKNQDEILRLLATNYTKYNNNKQLSEFYLKALVQQSSKLKKALEDENLTQEEKNKKIADFVRMKEMEIDNENRLTKIKQLKAKIEENEEKVREKYRKDLVGVRGTKAEANLISKINEEIRKSSMSTNVELQKVINAYVATLSSINSISEELFPDEKKGNGRSKKISLGEFDLESFNQATKDLISQQENVNKQIELSLADSEEEKLKIQEKYQIISLQRAKAAEIQKQKDALKAYEEKVNKEFEKEEEKNKKLLDSGKITQKQFTEWQVQASQEVLDKLGEADKKTRENVGKIIKNYDGLIDLYEKMYGVRLKAIGADDNENAKEIEKLSFYLEQYKTLMSGLTQFIDGEFQRQLTLEQNKTNALNEQLNNRLLNENLSKDERARIQQEIWQNDEKLRKKQNEIKKKQFNTQKAFNIVQATMDTYAAAVSASKETYGGPFAKIAAMTAVIGAGLAKVAMIARQKFQPEAASTPIRTASGGAGGGGVGDRSFNFNLVGANQQNQLVQAIQSQFDRPLRAYVVSKDITNQQQLDANTRATARFGG